MAYERRQPTRSSNRGTFSYWLPLAFTVTAATIGIAAWVWSERSEDDDDKPTQPPRPGGNDHVYPNYGRNADGSIRTGPPSYADVRPGEVAYGTATNRQQEESQSYMARMSGALRRTPSPQQVFDGATRSVVAGVTAAGAAVGSALSSIREEDKNAYKDHKTWQEEQEIKAATTAMAKDKEIELKTSDEPGVSTSRVAQPHTKRKTVAIVVSADSSHDFEEDDGGFHEHAVCIDRTVSQSSANATQSILSHLPRNTDFAKIRLFILIYAPGLKEHPLDAAAARPQSLSSSFSNIQTPGEEQDKTL